MESEVSIASTEGQKSLNILAYVSIDVGDGEELLRGEIVLFEFFQKLSTDRVIGSSKPTLEGDST